MAHTIIKQHVDIYQYPTQVHDKAKQATIGDLHGNAMLLLHFLVTQAVVSLPKADYEHLARIYTKDNLALTRQDIEQFNRLIEGLKLVDINKLVRLIGDELCDRGQNDYFTLKILSRLKFLGLNLSILFSNHAAEFIYSFEQKFQADPRINPSFSLDNLQILLQKGLITEAEVDSMVRAYLPSLKLVDYSIDGNKISLYTHAPVDLGVIKALALEYNIGYQDETIEALTQTIDAINHCFSEQVNQAKIHKLNLKSGAFFNLIWNRDYQNLNRKETHQNYQLVYVHGHDSNDPKANHVNRDYDPKLNIFNLDNLLGKALELNQGFYYVLETDEGPKNTPEMTVTRPGEEEPLLPKPISANQKFDELLQPLLNKILELRTQAQPEALKAAEQLQQHLETEWQLYQDQAQKDARAYQLFKLNCHGHFAQAHKKLDQHPGWTDFLINLLLGLTVIGLLIKGMINLANNRSFFFVYKTKNERVLDKLEEEIEYLASLN